MGEVTAFPARVPAPITAFMLAFIELVPPLVATTLIPACDFPAGHVGVNFDVDVGVVSGGGVGGLAGGGGGGGGDGGGGAGAAFFMAVAEFQPGDIWTTSPRISSDLRDQPLGMCIWRAALLVHAA